MECSKLKKIIIAIDGFSSCGIRTSGGVSNHFAVTEQLSNQFHVRSFTTTGASAGEFEQRSCKL